MRLSCEKKCQQNNEEHFYFFVAFPYGQVHVKQPVHWAACSRQAKSCMKMLVAQSYLILYNPMDYSTPGFFVHGILQARILEWVASPFSRESSVQFSSAVQLCPILWSQGILGVVFIHVPPSNFIGNRTQRKPNKMYTL